MKRLLILVTVYFIFTASPARAAEAGLFWKVSSDTASVYLLGVLPYATEEMYEAATVAEESFDESRRLLVYVDLLSLDPNVAAETALEMAKIDQGASLQELVSDDTWKQLVAVTTLHQVPYDKFVQQEPWLFAWSVTWFNNAIKGFDENRGMDRYFLARARDKEEIIALRSYAEWLGELDRLSKDEQEILLQASLVRMEAGKEYPEALVDAWVRGDIDRIAALQKKGLNAVTGAEELFQEIVDMRNAAMLEHLKRVFKQKGNDTFVIVRAEQVVGENGLPEILRKDGYKVERL